MQTNILRGFISILGAKVSILLLGLVITPILVRLLGSSLYGDYAFLISALSITMILVNAGIFDGVRKYMVEDRNQPKWVEFVFGFYLRAAIGLAILAATVYVAFSWAGFTDRFFGSEFTIYFYLLAGLIVSRQMFSVARGGLMGLRMEDRSEPLRVLKHGIFGVLGLSLAYLGYGVGGVLVGHIVASFLVSILGFTVLFRQFDTSAVFGRVPPRFPKQELLSFNVLSIILILLTSSLYHVDILLLRPMAGSQATGYYRAALVVAEFLWFVPFALQIVLLHSTSELWSKDRTQQISTLASRITRYNLSFILLLAIGLAALADDFLPLYFGPEFEASVIPLLILLPGVVGFALARPIYAVGQGKGELSVLIAATGVAAVMNLCLNVLLIPRYGTIGAAVATSLSYNSMIFLNVWAAWRIGFDPTTDLMLPKIVGVALIAGIVIFGMSSFIDSSIHSLIVVPPIGLTVYVILTFKLGIITSEDIREITGRMPNAISCHIETFL